MQLVYSGTTSIQVMLECPYGIQPHCFGLVTVNDESLMDCLATQPTPTPTSKLLVSFPDRLCRQHIICV